MHIVWIPNAGVFIIVTIQLKEMPLWRWLIGVIDVLSVFLFYLHNLVSTKYSSGQTFFKDFHPTASCLFV